MACRSFFFYVFSPPNAKVPRMSASGKRIGRPPKKGTHVATSAVNVGSLSGGQGGSGHPSGSGIRAGTPPPGAPNTPEGTDGTATGIRRKRKSPNKRPLNGNAGSGDHWMLGSTLNRDSAMAKEMSQALDDERKSHSAYDSNNAKHYLGAPFPGRRRVSQLTVKVVILRFFNDMVTLQRHPSTQSAQSASDFLSGNSKSTPQTLDELLERQWEQGSQFLMEQASHFDSKRLHIRYWFYHWLSICLF